MKNNNYNSLKTASKLKNWLACNYTTIVFPIRVNNSKCATIKK